MGSQDLFALAMTDWRFLVMAAAALVSIGGLQWQLKRLLALHAPDKIIAQAEDRAAHRADFRTSQEDIKSNLKRFLDFEEKTSANIRDLHAKIDNGSGVRPGGSE